MIQQTYFFLHEKTCPLCKSLLVSNGVFVWCSLTGETCSYGIDKTVRLEDA